MRKAIKQLVLRVWGWLPVWVRYLLLWLVNPKYIIGVLGIVTDADGRVLLFRHTYRGGTPWALPGGAVKRPEGLNAALQREFLEESGLLVAVDDLLLVDNREPRLLDFVLRCRVIGGEFRPSDEVSGLAYFAPDALPAEMEPRHRAIVREWFGLDAPVASGWRERNQHAWVTGAKRAASRRKAVQTRAAPDEGEGT